MKALVLTAYNNLEYLDFPDPLINDNEVLIKVKACGICGSDVQGMDGSTGRRQPPVIMGHEASGIIEKTGKQVRNWKAGDRVTFDSTIYSLDDWFTQNGHYNLSDNRQVLGVSTGEYRRQGAFAEYVAVPQHILYRIPGNVSFEHAATTEPIAVAHHAMNLAGPVKDRVVVVTGAGMVGAFLISLLKLNGASHVIALDINPEKLEMAGEFGADHAMHPDDPELDILIKDQTSGRGADLSFEVVGKSETVNTCIERTRKGGRIVLVGNTTPVIDFPVQKVVTHELNVMGSCAINGEYEAVLALLEKGSILVGKMISATPPLSEGAIWFDRLYRQESGLNKIILTP
ncbi:MAG: galactitol-1-phosphate 5-dehydrogenase [Bacteroidales bacterium]|nr:galactitol-1-phosphate 5-dehydrogenase [Bacteroidales bacterium]